MVGGAVRNALIGEPPGDIDVATTALPPRSSAAPSRPGFKAVPTGIEHGTVTVVVDGTPFEVTTLRQDVETFGRKASGALRPRLEGRRRTARLHHQRAVGDAATAPSTTMSAALPISRRAGCASSAMRRRASARTICASCASSASTRPTAMAPRIPTAYAPAIVVARRARPAVARTRAHGADEAAGGAARVPTLAVMARSRHPRIRARRRAAARARSPTWPRSRRRSA